MQVYNTQDYLFDTNGAQKGIYQRDIVRLRIKNVDKESIKKIHEQIEKIKLNNNDGIDNIRFNIILGPILNIIGGYFNNIPEYGNCSRWTSKILLEGGITTSLFV